MKGAGPKQGPYRPAEAQRAPGPGETLLEERDVQGSGMGDHLGNLCLGDTAQTSEQLKVLPRGEQWEDGV